MRHRTTVAPRRPLHRQRGAALLAAMLTVTLVAGFAASALWQQWRAAEVEGTERARVQAAWVLIGALDWSRLILREDARAGRTDHLSEPWALPLQEARLSSFLAADRDNRAPDVDAADVQEAFLSGQIVDMQSRMNIANLVVNRSRSDPMIEAFGRLFAALGLPSGELERIVDGLMATQSNGDGSAPLAPQRLDQLAWFGVSVQTLQTLAPYATVLPRSPTAVNINTASATVLAAMIPGLDAATAQRIVSARAARPFTGAADLTPLLGKLQVDAAVLGLLSADTHYFEVRGRLRMEQAVVEERSLVQRDLQDVRILWRERGALGLADALAAPATAER